MGDDVVGDAGRFLRGRDGQVGEEVRRGIEGEAGDRDGGGGGRGLWVVVGGVLLQYCDGVKRAGIG